MHIIVRQGDSTCICEPFFVHLYRFNCLLSFGKSWMLCVRRNWNLKLVCYTVLWSFYWNPWKREPIAPQLLRPIHRNNVQVGRRGVNKKLDDLQKLGPVCHETTLILCFFLNDMCFLWSMLCRALPSSSEDIAGFIGRCCGSARFQHFERNGLHRTDCTSRGIPFIGQRTMQALSSRMSRKPCSDVAYQFAFCKPAHGFSIDNFGIFWIERRICSCEGLWRYGVILPLNSPFYSKLFFILRLPCPIVL